MEGIRKALSLFLAHKWKFVLMIASAVAFAFLLFPFSDLSDLVSAQVYQQSGKQVYVQFEKMKMSVFPQAGVALEDVFVEGQAFPPLRVQELILTPSIMSLIYQKPAGTVTANGFLKGNIEVSLKPGGKSENGVERQKISLTAKQLSLAEIRNLAELPVLLKGNLNVTTAATVDLTFQEQPDVDVTLKIDRFELPSANVQTMMGPVTLPDVKLTSIELKGRLSAGRFIIEEGLIGKEPDEIRGTIKGNIGLILTNQGGAVVPQFSGYDLSVDLKIRKSFQDRANLFLTFIDAYKTPTPDGGQYRLKLSGANFQGPPNMSALR